MAFPEVYTNFLNFFDVALRVDGLEHEFVFGGPAGPYTATITVLWVKDVSAYIKLHTRGFNTVVNQSDRIFMMRANDVPYGATVYANDYITVDGTKMKVVQSRLRDGLWTIQLSVIGVRQNN